MKFHQLQMSLFRIHSSKNIFKTALIFPEEQTDKLQNHSILVCYPLVKYYRVWKNMGFLKWKACTREWSPLNSSLTLGLSKSQISKSRLRKLLCGNNKKVYLVVSFILTNTYQSLIWNLCLHGDYCQTGKIMKGNNVIITW